MRRMVEPAPRSVALPSRSIPRSEPDSRFARNDRRIVSYGSAHLSCQAKPSAALGMTEHAIRPSSKKAVGGFAALRKFSGADLLS